MVARGVKTIMNRYSAMTLAGCLSLWLGASNALAQDIPPGCAAAGNPNTTVEGALLGGAAGALIGNVTSGRHDKAKGTVLGGVGGAVAGALIGNNVGQGNPCPQGYVYRAPQPAQPVARYVEPPPPPTANRGEVWYGAPSHIRERIRFLRNRVEMMDSDGWLSPRESGGLRRQLRDIERQEARIRSRNDGDLPPDARIHLNDELNAVAGRLRWNDYRTEHADRY